MRRMDFAGIMAIIATALSLVAIGYSRRAARASERSALADERSAAADADTAALEADRRHVELTPRLRLRCAPLNPGSADYKLMVELLGPSSLGALDELVVTIRNDNPWRGQAQQRPNSPSREEVEAHVWGPLRFAPGTGPGVGAVEGLTGADSNGRTTRTAGLPVGEALPFILEATHPATWMDGMTTPAWRHERGTVVRLTFVCRKGTQEWSLVGEIDFSTDNPVVVPELP